MNPSLEPQLPEPVRFTLPPDLPEPVRIALVDASDQARAQLAGLLDGEVSCRVVGSWADAESTLSELPACRPQVIFLAPDLRNGDLWDCVRRLKSRLPGAYLLLYLAREDDPRLLEALIAGADGYCLKGATADGVVAVITEVCAGGAPMSPAVARQVLEQLRLNARQRAEAIRLTPREQTVLEQLSQGYRYKEIVANLGISFGTLHSYISQVYEKLQVHSRTEAVVKYLNR